jgi:hypothetical protein
MNAEQDDLIETRLRGVLADAAGSVTPSEGSLQQVLRRANRPPSRRWVVPVFAAAASVVVVAGAVAFVLRPQGVTSPGRGPGGGVGASHPVGSSTSSPSSTPALGRLAALPVYYAGVFQGQALLYREYVPVHTVDRGRDAAALSIAGKAADPDYTSLWPAGARLVSYRVSSGVAEMVLSAAPRQFPAMAVQQLVYTVTAADQSVRTVRISYGAVTVGPITRADPSSTLAPVWVLAPAQGATVHSPVLFSGTASVFEAVVSYELDSLDGTKVAGGSWLATTGTGIGSWSGRLSLPSGQYVIKAFEISPKDGTRRWVDTKSFTVQ